MVLWAQEKAPVYLPAAQIHAVPRTKPSFCLLVFCFQWRGPTSPLEPVTQGWQRHWCQAGKCLSLSYVLSCPTVLRAQALAISPHNWAVACEHPGKPGLSLPRFRKLNDYQSHSSLKVFFSRFRKNKFDSNEPKSSTSFSEVVFKCDRVRRLSCDCLLCRNGLGKSLKVPERCEMCPAFKLKTQRNK